MKNPISEIKAIELLKLNWSLRHDVPYGNSYELKGAGKEEYFLPLRIGDELVKSGNLIETYHQSGIHIYQWKKNKE